MDKAMETMVKRNLETEAGFAGQVAQAVGELLGSGYIAETVKIPKNNGTDKDALMIRRDGQQASSLVYLSTYFRQYQAGYPLDVIAKSIYDMVKGAGELSDKDYGRFGQMLDFRKVKGQIIYQMVNLEWNKKMLEGMPYKQICGDLAVIFLLLLGQGEHGQVTAQVTKQRMEIWGTSVDELWELSKANTPRLQPMELAPLQDMLKELTASLVANPGHPMEEDADGELVQEMDGEMGSFQEEGGSPAGSAYVLTNSIRLRGAAAILYPDALKRAAEQIGGDLIIFPSSIHETILVRREEGFDLEETVGIAREVNQEVVPTEDRLSDRVYYYSQPEGRIGAAEEMWDRVKPV